MINTPLYSISITFQDVMDNASPEIQDRFYALSFDEQNKFIEANVEQMKKGLESGLCDLVADVIYIVSEFDVK